MSGATTVQVYATDIWGANAGTIIANRTRIEEQQVSSSSADTVQSYSIPFTTGLVSHYDFSGDTAGALTTQPDLGSANLTLTAGATKPTIIANDQNGLAACQFTGSTNRITNGSSATASTSFDMWAVVSVSSVNSNHYYFLNGSPGTAGYSLRFGVNNVGTGTSYSSAGYYEGQGAQQGTAASEVPFNGWVIVEMTRTGEVTQFFVNGVSQGTGSNTPTAPSGGIFIGDNATVDVGECLLYNSALSSGNRTLIYNYLASKWDI